MEEIISGRLKILKHSEKGNVVLEFLGDVDEHFSHENIPSIQAQKIIFKLKEIKNFNSVGIREWIYMLDNLSKNNTPLEFMECSISMIDQINMVPDCLGNGNIISFYAPYYCSCEKSGEKNCLIVTADYLGVLLKKKAPDFKCEHCQNNLEFDALEESYFLFMNRLSKVA